MSQIFIPLWVRWGSESLVQGKRSDWVVQLYSTLLLSFHSEAQPAWQTDELEVRRYVFETDVDQSVRIYTNSWNGQVGSTDKNSPQTAGLTRKRQ